MFVIITSVTSTRDGALSDGAGVSIHSHCPEVLTSCEVQVTSWLNVKD